MKRATMFLVLALLLVGCSRTATPAAAPPAERVARDRPVTVSGEGIRDTEAFQLSGGEYRVTVQVAAGRGGCYHGSNLQPVEGFGMEGFVSEMLDDNERKTLTTNIYGLDPGRYYWSVSSGCGWAMTIAPA